MGSLKIKISRTDRARPYRRKIPMQLLLKVVADKQVKGQCHVVDSVLC